MQLTVRMFGCELLHISIEPESTTPDTGFAGDCTTYPIGFTSSSGDQRWHEHNAPDME